MCGLVSVELKREIYLDVKIVFNVIFKYCISQLLQILKIGKNKKLQVTVVSCHHLHLLHCPRFM
jgi:hypothetical protein